MLYIINVIIGIIMIEIINIKIQDIKKKNKLIKQIGLLICIILIYIGIYENYKYNNNILGFQNIEKICNKYWGIDGISLWLINLTIYILPLSILSNWNNINNPQSDDHRRPDGVSKKEVYDLYKKNTELLKGQLEGKRININGQNRSGIYEYIILIIIIGIIIILNFKSLDYLTFYVLFELSLIPLFIIIHIYGSENKIKAAYYIFIFTLFSSLFMLLSIGIYNYIIGNLEFININNIILNIDLQIILFIGLIIGILVKTPIFPFHIWLPLVHVESPIGISIILAGIIIKLAIYSIIRLILINLSDAVIMLTPIMYILSIITLFYCGLIILKQIDIKIIIAYSSIIHMSLAFMSIFSQNLLGLEGSIILSFGHGLTSPALFLLIGGILYDRYHTRLIYYYQSLITYLPIFSIYLFILSIFNMGLPLSINFLGEFLSINGIFKYNSLFGILSTFGILITTIYQMKLITKLLFGSKSIYLNIINDINHRELFILNILLIFIIILGIYPNLFINSITYSLSSLIYNL